MEFNELLEKLTPKLRGITHRLNTRFAYFDEEDLFQEAVIELWRKHGSNELSDKTDSYILQGAMFFLKNYLRVACKKMDRNSIHFTDNSENSYENTSLSEDMIPDKNTSNYEFILVDIAIDEISESLNERERQVFLMSMDELTTREIGEKLGVSHTMVIKMEKKIKEKCERLLKNSYLNNRQ